VLRQDVAETVAWAVTAVPGWKAWIVPIPTATPTGPAEYEVRVQRKGLDEIPVRSLAEWADIQQRLAQARPAWPVHLSTQPSKGGR